MSRILKTTFAVTMLIASATFVQAADGTSGLGDNGPGMFDETPIDPVVRQPVIDPQTTGSVQNPARPPQGMSPCPSGTVDGLGNCGLTPAPAVR